jgi:hypothetical protein
MTKCHGFFGVNVDRDLDARSLQLKMKPTTYKNKIRLDNEMIVWLCRTAMFKITLSQVLFSTWSG